MVERVPQPGKGIWVVNELRDNTGPVRGRAKRGEGKPGLPLGDVAVMSDERADELVAVNTALDGLTAIDPRKSRVFELRYFGGLNVEETAETMGISTATVGREIRYADAWLRRELQKR